MVKKILSFDHQLEFWEIKEKSGIGAVMAILLSLFYGRAINGHDDLGNADKTHCGKMRKFGNLSNFSIFCTILKWKLGLYSPKFKKFQLFYNF